jgi:O-methyltransferase
MNPRELAKRVLPPIIVDACRRVLRRSSSGQANTFTYNQDGLSTIHNADFLQHPRFKAAYKLAEDNAAFRGAPIHWRVYVACWCAQQAIRLEGDFVECGVYRGGLSRAIIEYVDFARTGKQFYLLDTYEGLVEKYISPEEKRAGVVPGGYEPSYEFVVEAFRPFPSVHVIKGPVPETLSQVSTEKVSYLSLDMNCSQPEVAAAEFFWPKLVAGGMILLDDYAYCGHPLSKKGMDEFANRKGVQILSLPTGQGLIIKL